MHCPSWHPHGVLPPHWQALLLQEMPREEAEELGLYVTPLCRPHSLHCPHGTNMML